MINNSFLLPGNFTYLQDGQLIVACTEDEGLYLSIDFGGTWHNLATPVPLEKCVVEGYTGVGNKQVKLLGSAGSVMYRFDFETGLWTSYPMASPITILKNSFGGSVWATKHSATQDGKYVGGTGDISNDFAYGNPDAQLSDISTDGVAACRNGVLYLNRSIVDIQSATSTPGTIVKVTNRPVLNGFALRSGGGLYRFIAASYSFLNTLTWDVADETFDANGLVRASMSMGGNIDTLMVAIAGKVALTSNAGDNFIAVLTGVDHRAVDLSYNNVVKFVACYNEPLLRSLSGGAFASVLGAKKYTDVSVYKSVITQKYLKPTL